MICPIRRFVSFVGELIERSVRAAAGEESRVATCGKCASALWAQGKAEAAIEVEQLSDHLTKRYATEILCGFLLSNFSREDDRQMFRGLHGTLS